MLSSDASNLHPNRVGALAIKERDHHILRREVGELEAIREGDVQLLLLDTLNKASIELNNLRTGSDLIKEVLPDNRFGVSMRDLSLGGVEVKNSTIRSKLDHPERKLIQLLRGEVIKILQLTNLQVSLLSSAG
jgi:hypothetical protein